MFNRLTHFDKVQKKSNNRVGYRYISRCTTDCFKYRINFTAKTHENETVKFDGYTKVLEDTNPKDLHFLALVIKNMIETNDPQLDEGFVEVYNLETNTTTRLTLTCRNYGHIETFENLISNKSIQFTTKASL